MLPPNTLLLFSHVSAKYQYRFLCGMFTLMRSYCMCVYLKPVLPAYNATSAVPLT